MYSPAFAALCSFLVYQNAKLIQKKLFQSYGCKAYILLHDSWNISYSPLVIKTEIEKNIVTIYNKVVVQLEYKFLSDWYFYSLLCSIKCMLFWQDPRPWSGRCKDTSLQFLVQACRKWQKQRKIRLYKETNCLQVITWQSKMSHYRNARNTDKETSWEAAWLWRCGSQSAVYLILLAAIIMLSAELWERWSRHTWALRALTCTCIQCSSAGAYFT